MCCVDAACQPDTFYIFRHAERFFAAAGNGVDDSQEILSPEGFVRSRALRTKFNNVSFYELLFLIVHLRFREQFHFHHASFQLDAEAKDILF